MDRKTRLLETLAESLDIPKSHYERAVARNKSLSEWFCRPQSRLAEFRPHVSPQGSFRHGTVIRPIVEGTRYDLDNVTTLVIGKSRITQEQLKKLHGLEVADYARAYNMVEAIEEKNRCWRLPYADDAQFHLDTLPSIGEDDAVVEALIRRGVSPELAARAVAITDRRHPKYREITPAWPSSNPRGFARWLEAQLRLFADTRIKNLVANRMYAKIDEVPAYEWKTPLQRAIQLLKRHRDVMFADAPDIAPISMILTNLAAHAYEGEEDLWAALTGIVERMPRFVRDTRPLVPNPADPAEDYADKWAADRRLEQAFWQWHAQLARDIQELPVADVRSLSTLTNKAFRLTLSEEQLSSLGGRSAAPAIRTTVATAPVIHVPSTTRPWGRRGQE